MGQGRSGQLETAMNPAFSDGVLGLGRGSKLARQVWGLQPGRLARSLCSFLGVLGGGGSWGRHGCLSRVLQDKLPSGVADEAVGMPSSQWS